MSKQTTRYSRFFARQLFAASLTMVIFLVGGVIFLVAPDDSVEAKERILSFLGCLGISGLLFLYALFLTKRLNRKTPQEQRKAVWWRAWRLGARLSFSGAGGFIRLITFGMLGSSKKVDIPEEDYYEPHWYDSRRKVRIKGVEYKVGRSGDYIKMGSEWVRVYREYNGDPYIKKDGRRIWLE